MPFRSLMVVILLAFVLATGVRAQEPTYNQEGFGLPALFVLSYPDAAPDFEGRRVRMMAGEVVPEEPLPAHEDWFILPGTVLRSFQVPPRGVLRVRLYNDRGAKRRLLCTINIRYYRTRDGNTFKAFNKMLDTPPLMYRSNTDLPNGDGYFSFLKLHSSVGPITIDSWTVVQQK
jgi:hypothetical protein